MERKNDPVKKSSVIIVLSISIIMIVIAFVLEPKKNDEQTLKTNESNLVKEKSTKPVFEKAYETEVVMINGDTVKVLVLGRRPFVGEVLVIADTIESGGYLAR